MGVRRFSCRVEARRRRKGERYLKVDMQTAVEVGKNVGKSANCNRRIWMGSTSVKRVVFIIFICNFFFSLRFTVLLFLTGTEYVCLFVPARNVYNRTPLSVFVALTVLSHIVCSFTQLTRDPSTSQNLPSCSTLTRSLTHARALARARARTHTHTHSLTRLLLLLLSSSSSPSSSSSLSSH